MKISSKSIAISGLVAGLYIALTLPLGSLATVPFFQIRPAEGLALLPILLPSSIFGLAIGCFLVNLLTSTFIDAVIGGLITLIAATLSRVIKNPYLAGIPPVLLNAIGLPIVFYFLGYEMAYGIMFLSILISQTVWVYALGLPMYFTTKKITLKHPELFR